MTVSNGNPIAKALVGVLERTPMIVIGTKDDTEAALVASDW